VKSLLVMETPGTKVSAVHQRFKFITIGDTCVGKSCLLLQYTDKKFRSELDPTIGCDCSTRIIVIDGKLTKINIWDTTGQEVYRSIKKGYYIGVAAAILVYDITRRETFDHIALWLNDVIEIAPPNLTTILVGNKCDLSDRRTVSYEEGETFAKTHGLFFLETSTKTAHNVEEAFTTAATIVSKKFEEGLLNLSEKFAVWAPETIVPRGI